MSEKAEGIPEPITLTDLPDISEHAKLADAAKRGYQSLGSVIHLEEFPKRQLDTIYLWWSRYPETKDRLDRLQGAVSSGILPKFEERDLSGQLEGANGKLEPIVSRIVNLTKKERVRESDLSPVEMLILEANNEEDWRSRDLLQAIALGEAIIETKDENLDEREIRIRIAQGAWEELLISFTYSKLHYAAETRVEVTTQDSLNEEKATLAAALKREPWSKRQLEKNKKVYLGLRKQIIASEYDEQILDNLKLVWDAARGSVPANKSALEILFANELVLTGLEREGALEWDLEEIEEEGEGEDEEED